MISMSFSKSQNIDSLQALFDEAKNKRSDINEHMQTLFEYTKRCESVLELGVRECVSSWAFLKGLVENEKVKKRLICNDLYRSPQIDSVLAMSQKLECNTVFLEINDLHIDLQGEEIDLCFIDTWHVYGHLKRELKKFAPSTRKYIIMHDTEVDKEYGESLRCGLNIKSQSEATGIPEDEIRQGLGKAVQEFLDGNPEWTVDMVKKNNNGLTVLKRVDGKKKHIL